MGSRCGGQSGEMGGEARTTGMISRERGEMRDRVSAEGSGLSWGQKRGPWRSAEPISSSRENTAYWDGVHTPVTSLQDVTIWLWRQAKARGDSARPG